MSQVWWISYATFLIVLALWCVMQWNKKLPSLNAWHSFLDSVNSRGGNIVTLMVLAIVFFGQSIRMFYWLFDASKDGKIAENNAFALMGLQFVTSSAFGGVIGALLKTMTSESSKGRASDIPNTTTTTTTSQTTSPAPKPESTPPAVTEPPAT